MAIGYISNMQNLRREDLVDYITNSDYKNTPLFSGLGEAVAKDMLHQWSIDVFSAAALNATIEGSDATTADLVSPTRKTNLVQTFRQVVSVSDISRAVNSVEGDPYAYQLKKASVKMARDIELAIIQGTVKSSSSGVAGQMAGIIAQITTNKSAHTSGTTLTSTIFNAILAGIFDNGTDEVANECYVGSYLKRVISGFTVGGTKTIQAADKRVWDTVDVYESDFGTVRIYLSRALPTGGILFVRPEYWKVAYLTGSRPKHIPLAKTGSSTKGMIEGSLTLEGLAEKTSAYHSGFNVG